MAIRRRRGNTIPERISRVRQFRDLRQDEKMRMTHSDRKYFETFKYTRLDRKYFETLKCTRSIVNNWIRYKADVRRSRLVRRIRCPFTNSLFLEWDRRIHTTVVFAIETDRKINGEIRSSSFIQDRAKLFDSLV